MKPELVEKIERGLQLTLSDRFTAEVTAERVESLRAWQINMVVQALADKRDFEYRHPATWWDALKDAILPASLKKWVKYKVITFKVLYPNFKPVVDDYIVHIGEN